MKHEKPELSHKNPFYLSRHRYHELKHFCLQYNEWTRALHSLNGWQTCGKESSGVIKGNLPSDPTEQCALLRVYYSNRIDTIKHCLVQLNPAIAPYILRGVTEGLSYDKLSAGGCPCGREMYYNIYREFFWLLSKERQ